MENIFRQLIVLFFLATSVHGQIIFEDNFDSHVDWQPTQQTYSVEVYGDSLGDTPAGYDGYRVQKTEWDDGNARQDTIRISSDNYRGASGKAVTFWIEHNSDGSGWSSDSLLNIELNSEGYDELYIRFFVKFSPDWKMDNDYAYQQKFLHVSHYEGGNPFQFFRDGNHHPVFIPDLARYSKSGGGVSDIVYFPSWRLTNDYYLSENTPPAGDSSKNVYFPPDGEYGGSGTDFYDVEWSETPAGKGMIGDGEWHCWEFRVKMNSGQNVPDGITEAWFDGVKVNSSNHIPFWDEGPKGKQMWNYVQIGGNSQNMYGEESEHREQWYALDDLVISTEYVGADYVIGSNPPSPIGKRISIGKPIKIGTFRLLID